MATIDFVRSPAVRNYTTYKGAAFHDLLEYLDTSDNEKDLTGWSATLKARPVGSADTVTPAISLTSTSVSLNSTHRILLGRSTGTILIDADVDNLPIGQYDYQFRMEDAAGNAQVLLIGLISHNEDIQ